MNENQTRLQDNILPLLLALTIGIIFATQYIGPYLADPYSVQDDFRQSFFWVWRFWDPTLFPDDFFAEMYKSHITRLPILNLIFHFAAAFKLDLIEFSKYFSIVIGSLSSLAAYLFFYSLSKNKLSSLFFTGFLSFVFYCTDHVSAAQARSFIWFGLLFYMYLKNINKNLLAACFCFVLLFVSPNTFMLCLGMEGFYYLLKSINEKQANLKSTNFISLVFNALSALVLYKVIFKDIQTQGVGTPYSKLELMGLAEFNLGGRHPIFGSSLMDGSWFLNEHWGFGIGYLNISNLVFVGLGALVVYLVLYLMSKKKIELVNSVLVLSLSSVSLYFLSQLTFPLLYLPSRYISIPVLLISIIVIFLCLEKIAESFLLNLQEIFPDVKRNYQKVNLLISIVTFLGFSSIYLFDYKKYLHLRFVHMNHNLAEEISQTPKDSVIAGFPLLPDINSASIFTKRKVYVDYERSMAYTKESLEEIRRRNRTVLAMTFAKTKEEFLRLAGLEGITHFLVLLDLYYPNYLNQASYMEPYNNFLRSKIYQARGKFFLKDYLIEHKRRHFLVDISKIPTNSPK